jgi:hypothetical protein
LAAAALLLLLLLRLMRVDDVVELLEPVSGEVLRVQAATMRASKSRSS